MHKNSLIKERTMKKKAFLTGILGIALIFAILLFVGCPTEDDSSSNNSTSGDNTSGDNTDTGDNTTTNPFKGTTWKWTDEDMTVTLTFTADTFKLVFVPDPTKMSGAGKYSNKGNKATLTDEDGEGEGVATISGDGKTLTLEIEAEDEDGKPTKMEESFTKQ
jgi:hypothetical protein